MFVTRADTRLGSLNLLFPQLSTLINMALELSVTIAIMLGFAIRYTQPTLLTPTNIDPELLQ